MDFGPSLPPHLKRKREHTDTKEKRDFDHNRKRTNNAEDEMGPRLPQHMSQKNSKSNEIGDSYGPELPQNSSIGPALPQQLYDNDDDINDNEEYGPAMPQKPDVGPALPSHLRGSDVKDMGGSGVPQGSSIGPSLSRHHVAKVDDEDDDDDCYGPALPPGYTRSNDAASSSRVGPVGPSLPTGMSKESLTNLTAEEEDEQDTDEDDSAYVIGPMPSSHSGSDMSMARTRADIEARSKATKDKMLGKNQPKQQRETWMTELPPELSKNFGMGARTFRAKAVDCGDRSVWTDSPAEKARREAEGVEYRGKDAPAKDEVFKAPWQEEKDKHMETMIQSYTEKHRSESLLDQHKKKLKKETKEDSSKPAERRPFDRDVDLAGSGLNSSQRQSLIKKSKQLGTRFHHAKKGSSFL